jgi:hypothetical protein
MSDLSAGRIKAEEVERALSNNPILFTTPVP